MKHLIWTLALVLTTGAAWGECASHPGETGHWVYSRHNPEHRTCWFRNDIKSTKISEKEWIPAERESDLKAQLEGDKPVHEARSKPRPVTAETPHHKRPHSRTIKSDPLPPTHAREKPLEVTQAVTSPPKPILLAGAIPDAVHEIVIRKVDDEGLAREHLRKVGETHLAGDSRPLPDLRTVVRQPTVALARATGTDASTKIMVGAGVFGLLMLLAGCCPRRKPRDKINWDAHEGYSLPILGTKISVKIPVAMLPIPRPQGPPKLRVVA